MRPFTIMGVMNPKWIAQLAKRYETPLGGLTTRLVNVNTFIYGKLYFPVRSNTAERTGKCVGASWSAAEASGLQSLVWRHRGRTRGRMYKERLLTYNAEDCQALQTLTAYLTTLQESADTERVVDFADQPKQHATARGEDIHRAFKSILNLRMTLIPAIESAYDQPLDTESREPKKRGAKKGHQAYQRLLPTRVGKVYGFYHDESARSIQANPSS